MRRSAVAAVLHDWQNNEEQRSYHEPLRQLATGGGYGILTDQKPFRPPLKQINGPQSLRKRPRVNYAGLEGASENDEAYKEEKEMPKKKNSLEGVYKGIDASGVSLNADRRKWAVYQAKPDAIKSKFTIPSMKNERAEFIENRLTHAALGVRKPIEVPPRPLYDPMSEHAIVLFDPTVDDKDAEQERERLRTAFEEQRKVLDRGPHKSLARILGLDKPKLVIEEKVPVVIDPRLGRILRPHQVEGVKFLYRCTTGMVSENAHGCIMADEMGLGKTLQCITLMWTLLRQSPRAGKGTIDKAIVVCPSSLVRNWANELVKWLGTSAPGSLALDGKMGREEMFQAVNRWAEAKGRAIVQPVMIVSYETLRNLQELLGNTEIGLMLCDEGHRLKNADSLTFQSLDPVSYTHLTLPTKA